MARPLTLNAAGMPEQPMLVLCSRGGDKIGAMIGTDAYRYNARLAGADELSFDIYKHVDGIINPLWGAVKDFRLVWYQNIDKWFQIQVELDETNSTVKHIIGTPVCEAELSQTNVYNIEINTEDDILNDDYHITVFYNEADPNGSLLDRLLYKSPNYKIGHVDSSLRNIQRTFSWGEATVHDALLDIADEVGCLFVFDSGTDKDTGKIMRTINAYDLQSCCNECGKRFETNASVCPYCGGEDIAPPYGNDSGIIVSRENLTQEIHFTTDVDSIKNCFRLEAGDDMMTAAVRYATPDGSGYLWYISDDMREDMSDDLRAMVESYDALYQKYITDMSFDIDSTEYNALIEKYVINGNDYSRIYSGGLSSENGKDIVLNNYTSLTEADYAALDFYYYLHDSMMPGYTKPDLSAEKQAESVLVGLGSGVSLLSISASTSAATIETSIRSMARIYIDSGQYGVGVTTTSWSPSDGSGTWVGSILLTNRADETDTANTGEFTISFTSQMDQYINQVLDQKINAVKSEAYDIEDLFGMEFDDFTQAIKQYSLTMLSEFYECCEMCLDVLIDYGCGNTESIWYNDIYLPWMDKINAISAEMDLRSQEVDTIQRMIDQIETLIAQCHEALDFETHLGDELWNEFVVFRREDTYQNSNFISDGLSNAEIVENARKFIDLAKREIYKSAMLQHSISATLHDLLLIEEFQPIADNFVVGSWIYILVDGTPYKLRLLEYDIDWSALDQINVTFSDVLKVYGGVSDVKSVLDSAAKMSTSYGAVMRKADKGQVANDRMSQWISKGLDATNTKLVSNATNQEMQFDRNGLYMRRFDDITNEYDSEQVKLINSTLAFTDDAWKTVKTAIGKYIDADGNILYGVIGEALVGQLLAGARLVIADMADDGTTLFRADNTGVYLRNASFVLDNGNGGGMFLDPVYGFVAGKDGLFTTDEMTVLPSFLEDGEIKTDGDGMPDGSSFYLDLGGNVYIRGNVIATAGRIGGLSISGNAIYSGSKDSFDNTAVGIYIGDDNSFNLGTSTEYIQLDSDGNLSIRAKTIALESTGKTVEETISDVANRAASDAVSSQTQLDIFNKLTNNGDDQGLYIQDGKLYLNATYMNTGALSADLIRTGVLQSVDDNAFHLDMYTGILNLRDVHTDRLTITGAAYDLDNDTDGESVALEIKCVDAESTIQICHRAVYGASSTGATWKSYKGSIGVIDGDLSIHGDSVSIIGNTTIVGCAEVSDALYVNSVKVDDFVYESGTDGVWTYRLWRSGVIECWSTQVVSNISVTTEWGNIYVSNSDTVPSISYPFTFASIPCVTTTPENNGADWWLITRRGGSESASPSYQVGRGTANSSMSIRVNQYVIGRLW